jgi:hypothetical protein
MTEFDELETEVEENRRCVEVGIQARQQGIIRRRRNGILRSAMGLIDILDLNQFV